MFFLISGLILMSYITDVLQNNNPVCIGYEGYKWAIWVSTPRFRRYEEEKPCEQHEWYKAKQIGLS